MTRRSPQRGERGNSAPHDARGGPELLQCGARTDSEARRNMRGRRGDSEAQVRPAVRSTARRNGRVCANKSKHFMRFYVSTQNLFAYADGRAATPSAVRRRAARRQIPSSASRNAAVIGPPAPPPPPLDSVLLLLSTGARPSTMAPGSATM